MILIALTGAAHSGKLWVSSRLCERHGFTPVRFTDAIKLMLEVGLGIPSDAFEGSAKHKAIPEYGGATPIRMMQAIGYAGGRRSIHPDVWIVPWAKALERAGPRVVVDDLRWPNEEAAVRARGGVLWEVQRPSVVSNDSACAELTSDGTIMNDGNINDLMLTTDRLIGEFLAAKAVSAT